MISNINIIKELKEKYIIDKDTNGYYLKLYNKTNHSMTNKEQKKILPFLKRDEIKVFINTMKENNKEKYLDNLYSNLRITKIVDSSFIQHLFFLSGTYGCNYYRKNNIFLVLGNKIDLKILNATLTPYHELLHLLTTKVLNRSCFLLTSSSYHSPIKLTFELKPLDKSSLKSL